jgi:hypothetical protein
MKNDQDIFDYIIKYFNRHQKADPEIMFIPDAE